MQNQLKGWFGINRFSSADKPTRASAASEIDVEYEPKNESGVPIHYIFAANEDLIESLFNSQKEVSANSFLHDLTHSECEYWRFLRLCLMNDLTLVQPSENAETSTETANVQVSSKAFIFSILKRLNPNVHRSESVESKKEESQHEMLDLGYEIDMPRIDTEAEQIDKGSLKDVIAEDPAELVSVIIEAEDVKSNKDRESAMESVGLLAVDQNDVPKIFVTEIVEPIIEDSQQLKIDKQELELASIKVNKPEQSAEHQKENGDGSQMHPGSSKHEPSDAENTRKRYKKGNKKDNESEHSNDNQKELLPHRDRKPDYKFYNSHYRRDDYNRQDYNDRNNTRRHPYNQNSSRNTRDNRDQNDTWRESRNDDYRSKRYESYEERKFGNRQRN